MSKRLLRATALVALVGALLAGCAIVPAPGVADRPAAGSCHLLTQQAEFATASDSRPAVGCGRPHTSETYEVAKVPAPYSSRRRPPDAAVQAQIAGDVCTGNALDAFLGADTFDGVWGIWTVSFLPTADAWSHGARWMRCDAVQSARDDALRPVTRRASLHAALRGPHADALLRCYRQPAAGSDSKDVLQVPCDRAHTARDLNDWRQVSIPPEAGDFRGDCTAEVTAYRKAPATAAQVAVIVIPSGDGTSWSVRCAVVTGS